MAFLSTCNLLKNAKSENRIELTDSLLNQLHGVLLEILKDFSNVCEKNGFYYSLSGGSALGAVRHNGFIPWDDDVDVFMTRKDYDEFVAIFDSVLGDKYVLHSMETTPELGFPVVQMMKKGTTFKINGSLGCEECGVFIDIFILENCPDNRILRFFHGVGSLFFGLCLSCSRFYNKKEHYYEMYGDSEKSIYRKIKTKIFLGKLLSWRRLEKWAEKYTKWNALCKNNKSEYVVCPTGVKHYFKEMFPRNIYCVTKTVNFEDTQMRVIENYDWALSRLYGDYMKIPPKEKREQHFVLEIKL